jgi:hypothetical protein
MVARRASATTRWTRVVLALGTIALSGCARSSSKNSPAASSELPLELENILSKCVADEKLALLGCPEHKAWVDSPLARAIGHEKELFALAADARPLVRFLAARAIAENACEGETNCPYAKSRELSERLLAVAEAERDARVAAELVRPVLRIDSEATGLDDRIERMLESGNEELAKGILSTWLEGHPERFPSTVRFADSPQPLVRRGALDGLHYAFGGPRHEEACALAVRKFGEGSEYDFLASIIVVGVEAGPSCSVAWDDFITQAEGRREKGLAPPPPGRPPWFSALFTVPYRSEANLQQVERVIAFAVAVAEDRSNDEWSRNWALDFAAQHVREPHEFLNRFAADPVPKVRERAEYVKGRVGNITVRPAWTPRPPSRPRQAPPPRTVTTRRAAVTSSPAPSAGPTPSTEPDLAETTEADEDPATARKRGRLLVRATLSAIVLILALVAALVARRRYSASRATAEPIAPSAPEAGSHSSSRSSPAPAGSSRTARAPCALHGIATGPDGRCVLCRASPEPSPSGRRSLLNWKQLALAGIPVLLAIVYYAFDLPTKRGRRLSPNPGEDAGHRFSSETRVAQAAANDSNRAEHVERDRMARLDEYFDEDADGALPRPSEAGITRRMGEFDIEVLHHYETPTRLCETLQAYGMRCRQRAITMIKATSTGDEPLPPSLNVDGRWAGIDVSSDEKVIESLRSHASRELINEYLQRQRQR